MPNPRLDTPSIVAEFVSAGKRNRQRDYVEKKQDYQAAGIGEYWVIDRFRRIMTVHRADGSTRVVTESETYRTPLLPGFELPLARLLAVADRWAASEGGSSSRA